jgi:hypothetical protein
MFIHSWELKKMAKPFDLPSGEYKHVYITGVEPVGNEIRLDLEDVPVQAHPYPQSTILNLSVFEKNTEEHWAIGKDTSGQSWAFFRKTQKFGRYWIAAKLNFSKTDMDRIDEKTRKGYRSVGDARKNRFDLNLREVVIIN